jgi:hypothetical protein
MAAYQNRHLLCGYASISMRIQSAFEQAGIFFAKLRRECLECDLGIFGDDR